MKRQAEDERKMELKLAEDLLTGGVHCAADLSPLLDTTGAEDDRVVLPQSIFDSLNKQDAFSLGPVYFQLSSPGAVTTHCGVREFTAMENAIILPQKVAASLFGAAGLAGPVSVKYVRLPKVKHVKLQPLENKFYSLDNVKLMLEDNLKHHSTLTVGDLVTVWHRGEKFLLKVSAMQPEQRGSLIDTDVEVDLDESVEYKHHIKNEQDAAGSRNTIASSSGHVLGSAASSASSGNRLPTDTESVFRLPVAPIDKPSTPVLSNVSVPEEPQSNEEGSIYSKFRIPGGSLTRRFSKYDSLAVLFAYVRSQAPLGNNISLCEMCEAGKVLQLTTRFPNRTITEMDDMVKNGNTLEDAGITSPIDFIVGVALI